MTLLGLSFEDITKIPCSKIKTHSPLEIEYVVDATVDYYYQHGFPYYPRDNAKIEKEYSAMRDLDVSRILLPNRELQQFMLGLNTINTFHPEMWSTRCRNAPTPMDVFLDRDAFKNAIRKRIKYSDTKLAPYNIRKSLKAFGVQSVSNFRPTIAKWVYETFSPAGANVLDPCAGYGGRMFGAMCSHIGRYVGIDPNAETQKGNSELRDAIHGLGNQKIVDLHTEAFEDFSVYAKIFDLVFTSPPYFNIEKYSTDQKQSWVRYDTIEKWYDGFLRPLFVKSEQYLVRGGFFVINVGEPITAETIKIGTAVFGTEPTTYHMRLSKMLGRGNKSNISHKTEPIFVWGKR